MIDFKDFKIKRGPAKDLHSPRLIVEEGYWYLSTDSAELFIGIVVDGIPQLKPINDTLFEAKLANYATVDFVREALESIDIPEISVDDFATKEELNNKADTSYVDEKVANIVSSEGLATEEWVKKQNYLTEHIDISGKQDIIDDLEELRIGAALGKTALQEIPTDYAKKDDLFNKDYNELINKPEGLATESFVLEKIAEAEIGEKEIDLSVYAKKEDLFSKDYYDLENRPDIPEAYDDKEVRNLIANKAESSYVDEKILEINSKIDTLESHEPYDDSELRELLNGKSDKDHKHDEYIQDLSHLATKEELSNYITEDILNSKGYITDVSEKQDIIEDLSEIRANAELGKTALQAIPEEFITESELEAKGYLTDHQSLDNYYNKTEVDNLINSIELTPGQNGIDGKDGEKGEQGEAGKSAYQIWLDLGNTGTEQNFIDSLKGEQGIQGIQGEPGVQGEKGERGEQGLQGPQGESGKDGLTTAVKVGTTTYTHENGVINLPNFVDSDYVTEYVGSELDDRVTTIGSQIAANYATKTYVDDAINNALTPDNLPDVLPDVLPEVIPTAVTLKDLQIGETFTTDVTVGKLEAGTEIKSEMTFGELLKAVFGVRCNHDWQEATCTEPKTCKLCGTTEGVALGHNPLPAVEENRVEPTTTSVGSYESVVYCNRCDEELSRETIEIPMLAPEEPEIPEGLIGDIITNKREMYVVNHDGSLEAIPFEINILSEEQAAQEPNRSGFYQVVTNEGNTLEAGYHDLSVLNPEWVYMVVLPKEVKAENISVQTFSDEDQIWEDSTFELTNDVDIVADICDIYEMDISAINPETHTVWVSVTEQLCTGSKIRYIITD